MRRARARRRRSQALECAPLAGASAGLMVAGGLTGWMVGGWQLAGLAGAGMALLTAAVLGIPNALRRRLRLHPPESVAAILGALAAVVTLAGAWRTGLDVHPVVLASTAIGGAMLLGGAIGWAGPAGPDEALARELDRRAHLAESLATACHLAGRSAQAHPWQGPVVHDALARARRSDVHRLSLNRRGPGPWAMLAGAAGVAMAAALLVSTGMPRHGDHGDLLARLNQPQRSEFIEFLRQQRQAQPDLAAAINEAIIAIEVDDPDRLGEALDRLRQAGFDVQTELPQPLRAQLAGTSPAGSSETGSDTQNTTGTGSAQTVDPSELTVWTPPTRSGGTGGDAADQQARAGVDYQDAWRAAQSHAMDRLRAGRVPPHRRDLIRRYFQPTPAN